MCSWCQPSPEGRGWPAAGAFTSRSGPGEGLPGRGSNTRVKQSSNAPFCSCAGLVEVTSILLVGTDQGSSICKFGLNFAVLPDKPNSKGQNLH